jgi:beta-galactosidase/beta-glucuronidase
MPEGTRPIQVPYAYETPSSGIGETKEHQILWYFKSFTNPQWSEKILLHFERIDYVFDGWLNGHYLGKHIGGYDAFCRDITDYLRPGENLLSIRVYDDRDPSHLRGKQSCEEKPSGCFYTPTSGIYGDVWVEEVNPARVQGYDVRGSYDEKAAYFRLLFTPEAIGETLTIDLSYRGEKVASKEVTVSNIYHEEELPIPPKAFHAWTPAHPCLYDLRLSLKRNEETTDTVLSYFGVNQVEARGNRLLLNGKRRYLKFMLYQGYNPRGGLTFTEEESLKDIALVKAMGFNGVRVHEKVESEVFYYLADREGLLTDLELPSAQQYNRFENDEIQAEFGRIVTDHVGHPSLIAYVANNESWGVQDIDISEEVREQQNKLYEMANRIDWTRPVISNDGWEATETDLVALHNYSENGAKLLEDYAGLKNALAHNENFVVYVGKKAFAGDYHYSGQPYFLSEFFGVSLKGDQKKGWGYYTAADAKSYLRTYRSLLRAIKKLGFSGYCVTQFADTYQEKNGFVDDERTPKASLAAIKRANQSF